jgi:hypothetical protein
MRLRHGELEGLRTDLRGWVANKKKATASHPSMSYTHATRMAIYRLHRGQTLPQSIAYLDKYLDAYHLLNKARRSQATHEIAAYAAWLQTEGDVSIATKSRLKLAVFGDTQIGGEIPRVDILPTSVGYRAIMIGESDPNWPKQLRMPLIQRGIAHVLKRPEALIHVGVQGCDGSNLQTIQFSGRRISAAVAELQELVSIAQGLLNG